MDRENQTANPRRAVAYAYLKRGWSVLALCPHDHAKVPGAHEKSCKSPGKAPLFPWNAYQERLPSEHEVKIWWNRHPNANVGVVYGPVSNLVGIDIDGPEGEALLEQLSDGNFPETLQFTTPGGGRRILFQWDERIKTKVFKSKDGGDALRIQGKGAQTVMPPSIHYSGGEYAWIEGCRPGEVELAPCPEWLIRFCQKDDQPGVIPNFQKIERIRKYLQEMGPCHPEPEHLMDASTHLLKAATAVVLGFDLSIGEAVPLLMEWDRAGNPSPYPEKEIRRKCEEAIKLNHQPRGYLLHDEPPHRAKAGHGPQDKPSSTRRLVSRSMDQIAIKALKWLFKNRIPLGKVTVLDGDPDLGKSTLMLDLAARLTRGELAPDSTPIECGAADVLIMSGEDDPEDTIRPRLELAGAELARVHFLDQVASSHGFEPPLIPRDLDLIEEKIHQTDAKLLVIDPLMAFLDADCDSHKDQSVRRALHQLALVARHTGCAIVLQRHWNKSSNQKAIYRGGGSIAISAHARSALMVATDPDDDTKRLLAIVKKNRGGDAPTLRFELVPVSVALAGEPDTICRIDWCGISPYKAEDLVQAPKSAEDKEEAAATNSKLELAEELLKDLERTGGGKVLLAAAAAEAKAAKISERTLERAVQKMGFKPRFHHTPEGRVYHWSRLADGGVGYN